MKRKLLFISTLLLATVYSFANITLPKVLSSNMVLQQNAEIVFWGWADKGEKVSVEFANLKKEINTNKKGEWKVIFPPMEAGYTEYTAVIKGKNTVELTNLLIGDVWICSGQSNMEWPMRKTNDIDAEVLQAENNHIRLFKVPRNAVVTPVVDVLDGTWLLCDSASIQDFSAVGYYFGKNIQKETDIPIGLINTSWGGTIIETWISPKAINELADYMANSPTFSAPIFDMKGKNIEEVRAKYDAFMAEFGETKGGMVDDNPLWAKPDLDVSTWKEMPIPQLWENAGLTGLNGVVWYRKEIEVSAEMAADQASLSLGPIDDGDITWVNGTKVGETPDAYDLRRVYTVPKGALKEGKNIITVRVVDGGGGGGFYGSPSELKLFNSKESVPLAGTWKFRISPVDFQLDKVSQSPNSKPSLLFNGMINPLLNLNVKGAIWYQGESNASDAYDYRTLFPALIEDWREQWNNPEMPFLFVQLANFKAKQNEPIESAWAELREAQTMTLKLNNTGMAVIIDIGEAGDIHPRNKKDVGYRLSLAGRKIAYGEDIVYSGPSFSGIEMKEDKAILSFTNIGGGLISSNKYGYLSGFAISGADKKWYWAQAHIEGDEVVVFSPEVKNPVAVRYGWADNPDCELYNKEGLPASPFATDNWQRITQK